jgi:hypothetical protein
MTAQEISSDSGVDLSARYFPATPYSSFSSSWGSKTVYDNRFQDINQCELGFDDDIPF